MRPLACLSVLVMMVACGGTGSAGTDIPAVDLALDRAASDPGPDTVPDPAGERLEKDLATEDPGLLDPGPGDPGLPEEDATDPGSSDPAPTDPAPVDPGVPDPAPLDPGAVDTEDEIPASGTKVAGERCTDAAECSMGMSCIQGRFTPAHCNIQCGSTAECQAVSPGTNVTCLNIGATGVCMWTCFGGKPCPGGANGLKCGGYYCDT